MATKFVFGEKTGSYLSCSAIINGRMTIFGGSLYNPYKNQISVIESCRLTRVGHLPMHFFGGACNTFTTSSGQEETLLCFGMAGENSCHRSSWKSKTSLELNFSYDGKDVTIASSSRYSHALTSLGRLENLAIAVGSVGKPGNIKVEALQSGTWLELADFPFANRNLYSYSTITFNDSLYLFGKFCFLTHAPLKIYWRWQEQL